MSQKEQKEQNSQSSQNVQSSTSESESGTTKHVFKYESVDTKYTCSYDPKVMRERFLTLRSEFDQLSIKLSIEERELAIRRKYKLWSGFFERYPTVINLIFSEVATNKVVDFINLACDILGSTKSQEDKNKLLANKLFLLMHKDKMAQM